MNETMPMVHYQVISICWFIFLQIVHKNFLLWNILWLLDYAYETKNKPWSTHEIRTGEYYKGLRILQRKSIFIIIQTCPTYNNERCSRLILIEINMFCQYITLTFWKYDTFCWMAKLLIDTIDKR